MYHIELCKEAIEAIESHARIKCDLIIKECNTPLFDSSLNVINHIEIMRELQTSYARRGDK